MPILRMIFWGFGAIASTINGLVIALQLFIGDVTDRFVWGMALFGCICAVTLGLDCARDACRDHTQRRRRMRRYA